MPHPPNLLDLSDAGEVVFVTPGGDPVQAAAIYVSGRLVWTGTEAAQTIHLAWAEPWVDASTGVIVSWCSDSADGRLHWRPDGAGVWRAKGSQWTRPTPDSTGRWLHSVRVTGLAPGAEIEVGWPGSAELRTLRTAPAEDVVVIWASDQHGNASAMATGATPAQAFAADLIVMPGDLVSDDGARDEAAVDGWLALIGSMNGWVSGRLPLLAFGLGNHDMNGAVGPIDIFASAAWWEGWPDRLSPATWALSVGAELRIIHVDTGWIDSVASQAGWIAGQVAEAAAGHRHVMVCGHSPAFGAAENFPGFDAAARAVHLREIVWPILCAYADRVRAYVCGHEHILTATAPLVTEPDPALDAEANWLRWRTVAANAGVRQIGAGPVGGTRLEPDASRATGAVSSLDASPRMIAAYGQDGSGEPVALGDILAPTAERRHFWVTTHGATGWTATAVSIDGATLYQISED